MNSMRSSTHYVWSTSWVLGKGATGAVYQGMHKNTGEPVAVKTFNHNSHLRPVDVQMREFEVLKKLNHDNIVRMLAMEEEVESQKKVLIMELCTAGSLFSILDDPQNSYGLEEEEFLCVLKDLSAGMKYLRDNNIIHRDLKPGNIMKFITEDGKSVYKLIDFGAARELEEDQQFMSLYGTEEYLHPDMYERAVLRHPHNKSFRATVDLWSIGVTLYHVATGSLPFRPYGGRKNKETMFYITTKKASGVISGVQHSENGPIEWSKELPKTCLLNQGIRELVTSLLAGILECNDEKMMPFDQFFQSVTDIISRRVVHVFYMNEGKEVSLYMPPQSVFKDVKDQIAAQVKVPPGNQTLLFNNSFFDSLIDPNAKVTSYPVTTCSKPLILLHNENTDVKDLTRFGALSACFPMFHTSSVNIDHDAALAKTCCGVAHAVKRHVEKLVRCRSLLLKTPKILLTLIFRNVTDLCVYLDVLEQRVDDLDKRFCRLEKSSLVITDLLNCWPEEHQCKSDLWNLSQLVFEKKQMKEEVSQNFTSLQSAINTLKQRVLVSGLLQKEWDQAMTECSELTGCAEKAETYVNKIRDSWQALMRDKTVRDRNGRALSFHDEQFHILEKVKVQQTSKKLSALLQEQCLKSCLQASQKLDEWYSGMQATMVQCKCLEQDLSSVGNLAKNYGNSMNKAEIEADRIVQKILNQIKTSKASFNVLPPSPKHSLNEQASTQCSSNGILKSQLKSSPFSEFLDKLQDLSESHNGLRELVNEHDSLIERLVQEKQCLKSLIFDADINAETSS